MLSQNISEQNAFMRMTCGIALACFGTARIARNPNCLMGKMMIMAGAMKVAEGYYQYCPVVALVADKNEEEMYY
ncbi:YgaP-like transmembrane domain [Lysinibacillus sp. LZ02]|uniref:YgaP-like transmembrane domain n=1 Tax=Lysinibacillus sp. LZ02 TaxID=3420668 RepID=UPI003D36243C